MELLPDEHIIWEGKPNHELKEKKKTSFDKIVDFLVFLEKLWYAFVGLILLVFGIMKVIDFGFIISIVVQLLLFLIVYIVFSFVVEKRKEKTKFVITNKRIFFYSWHLFKGDQLNTIDYTDIEKISLEEYKNDIGTIFLMGRKLGSFKNTPHYPALVAIENAKEVKAIIEKYL